jgi:lysozyme
MVPAMASMLISAAGRRRTAALAVAALFGLMEGGCTRSLSAAPAGAWPVGVDVASHQHPGDQPIDWKTVRNAGVSFAMVKVDEGPHGSAGRYVNPWFGPDWNGARAAGLLVGAYHYARPRLPVATAGVDARTFAATVGPSLAGAALPPVLDLEESGALPPADLIAWVRQWLDTVQALAGRPPVVYTGKWFWDGYLAGTPELAGHPLWIARYADRPGVLPGAFPTWSFWQFTARGRVPGIPAPVDVNVSCGSVTDLTGECRSRPLAAWQATTRVARV